MKLLPISLIAVACFSASASAQHVMDNSSASVGQDVTEAISSALKVFAADPYSAQIADMKPAKNRTELICFKVNLKNGFGAYTGFQQAAFDTKYGTLLINQNLTDCRY